VAWIPTLTPVSTRSRTPEWLARRLGEGGRESHLDTSLSHPVSAHREEQRLKRGYVPQLAPEDRRDQISLQDRPGRLNRLVGIPGPLPCDALAPMRPPIDLQAHQQRIAVLLHAEARAKGFQQSHLQNPQLDGVDLHGRSRGSSAFPRRSITYHPSRVQSVATNPSLRAASNAARLSRRH